MNRDQIVQSLLHPNKVADQFFDLAMGVFHYQLAHCSVYKKHVKNLGIEIDSIQTVDDIPCLPITAFKNYKIVSSKAKPQLHFESSGTTSAVNSKHYVSDLSLYRTISELTFYQFYGPVADYCILGLLPSYLERNNSSLVYMVDHFISQSKDADSGFYLNDHNSLMDILRRKQSTKTPTILIGVSFALMDLALLYKEDLSNIILMETGGMKGKRKELPRASLHAMIKTAFNVSQVHSEYGMTELLSQGYSQGNGLFREGYTMRCLSKQITDPLTKEKNGKTGVLNIIDLANIDSCSFIETQDLVKIHDDRTFEILGRIDQSDLRGCNLMLDS